MELTDILKRKKGMTSYFLLKIDLSKAFDCLEWSFIRQCLHHFKLPPKLIELILFCITSYSSSVIVNGKTTEPFQPTKGLRQGDPMSPYIFIMCMEYLGHLISLQVQNQNWKPLPTSRTGLKLSYFFYADDLVLCGINDQNTINGMHNTLKFFSTLSGLYIDLTKSKVIFSGNTTTTQKVLACSTLSIEEAKNLGKYLGFPICKGAPKKSDLHFILDKVHSKLASWKCSLLSPRGRTILIQSTLLAMPAYTMQLIKSNSPLLLAKQLTSFVEISFGKIKPILPLATTPSAGSNADSLKKWVDLVLGKRFILTKLTNLSWPGNSSETLHSHRFNSS